VSSMFKSLTVAVILGGTLMLSQPAPASAQRFIVRRPGPVVVVRPSYGYWPHTYGYGWYGYGYNPWWGRGYVAPSTGEVKLVTPMKDASVYINGAYAGVAGKLKHFDLSPGSYEIELRYSDGRTLYHDRVQVLLDKKTEIHAG